MSKRVLFFLVIFGLSHVMEAYVFNDSGYLGGIHPYFGQMMKRSHGSWENSIHNHMNHVKTFMEGVLQHLQKTRLQLLDNALGNGKLITSDVIKISLTCCKNGTCVTVHDPTSLDCNRILENKKQQEIDDDPDKDQTLVEGQEIVTDTTTQPEAIDQTPVDEQQEFDSVQTAEAATQ